MLPQFMKLPATDQATRNTARDRRRPQSQKRSRPPRQTKSSMRPASTGAITEESYPQPPSNSGPSSLSATKPCSVLNPCPSPPQYSVIPSAGKSSSPLPLPGYMAILQNGLQNGLISSLDTYDGPVFRPSDSPCVNCNSMPPQQPIDLLNYTSVDEVLTPEQKKKLDERVEDWVRDQIKDQIRDLKYKPFEAAFEAQKTAVQEKAAELAGGWALAMCGGPELPTSALCAAAGAGVGWYAAGKAFDKVIEIPIDSISSGSSRPH
jgi:hypothetical protein